MTFKVREFLISSFVYDRRQLMKDNVKATRNSKESDKYGLRRWRFVFLGLYHCR